MDLRIPVTILAAFLQNARSALQRSLLGRFRLEAATTSARSACFPEFCR